MSEKGYLFNWRSCDPDDTVVAGIPVGIVAQLTLNDATNWNFEFNNAEEIEVVEEHISLEALIYGRIARLPKLRGLTARLVVIDFSNDAGVIGDVDWSEQPPEGA